MGFKDNLKQLRLKKGVTQTELANSVLVSRSTVAKWENGLSLPNEQSVELLAQYFGVDKIQLLPNQPMEETMVKKNIVISKTRKVVVIVTALCVLLVVALAMTFALLLPSQQVPALEDIVSNGATWSNIQLGGLSVKQLESKWGKPDSMSGEYTWLAQDSVKIVVTAQQTENGKIVVQAVTLLYGNIPSLEEIEQHDEQWAQERLVGITLDKLHESWGQGSPFSGFPGYAWVTENSNRIFVYPTQNDEKKEIIESVRIAWRAKEIPNLSEISQSAEEGESVYLYGFTIAEVQDEWGAGVHDKENGSYLWQLSNGLVLRVWYNRQSFKIIGSLIQRDAQ